MSKTKSEKTKRRRNRRKEGGRRFDPVRTPTHYLTLKHIRVQIDTNRRWFVLRTVAQQEAKITKRLNEIARECAVEIIVHRATETVEVARRGRLVVRQQFPAAGYLILGLQPGPNIDYDKAQLRSWSDREQATGRGPLFVRIMGPFHNKHAVEIGDFLGQFEPPLLAIFNMEGRMEDVLPMAGSLLGAGEKHLLTPIAA